jgi:hypothetical protein
MLTPSELSSLQAIIRREQQCPAPPTDEFPADIGPGDVVQIRPFADATFGGMLVLIMKAEPYQLHGFLLRPHRGGCKEAWLKLKHCEVERVGHSYWPDSSDFARRCPELKGPDCRYHR